MSSFFGVGYRKTVATPAQKGSGWQYSLDYYRPEDVEVPLAVLEISCPIPPGSFPTGITWEP